MPKIFEYLGIIIMFYSNEHALIHVHGKGLKPHTDHPSSSAIFFVTK